MSYTFLYVECKILPEFLEFYEKKYFNEMPSNIDSKKYRNILDIWNSFHIHPDAFSKYTIHEDIVSFELFVEQMFYDYTEFLRDIIVPTTIEIVECMILDSMEMPIRIYTDLELRDYRIHLEQLVKTIHHTFEEDEIVESRIIYKRGISKKQEIDLNRLFGITPLPKHRT